MNFFINFHHLKSSQKNHKKCVIFTTQYLHPLASFIIFHNFPYLLFLIFLETKQIKNICMRFFGSVSSSIISSLPKKIFSFIIYSLDRFYGFFMSYNNALFYSHMWKAQQDFSIFSLIERFFLRHVHT